MGINVENKWVSIDPSHQELVDTSVTGNPTKGVIGDLSMHYIFRRKRTKTNSGDGNPLVYALKEIYGYRMQPNDFQNLFQLADQILEGLVDKLNVTALVDVPSSKPLCQRFATRASEILRIPLIESAFLRKLTIGEVLDSIDANFPNFPKKKDSEDFISALGILRKVDRNVDFQMKEVSVSTRHLFRPFGLNSTAPNLNGQRIALIDDLVSTGASLKSVAESLREEGAIVECGVCLLSDLKSTHTSFD